MSIFEGLFSRKIPQHPTIWAQWSSDSQQGRLTLLCAHSGTNMMCLISEMVSIPHTPANRKTHISVSNYAASRQVFPSPPSPRTLGSRRTTMRARNAHISQKHENTQTHSHLYPRIYICIWLYVYIHIYIYIYVYIYTHICIFTHANILMYICIHMYTYICIHFFE